MPLPNEDPSDPGLPAPIFADVDAVRGDQLRALCQLVWGNLQYLFDFTGRTTDTLTEGITNLYFTATRVLAAVLTGFSVGANATIAATDTVLQAFAKTQGQINALQSRPYLISGTSQATTSGTSKDFTGLPAGLKRIVIEFAGCSLSGAAYPVVQIGSGSVDTSGYIGATSRGTSAGTLSLGFLVDIGANANAVFSGAITLTLEDAATDTWACAGSLGVSTGAAAGFVGLVAGHKILAGALDRVRVTSSNGSDTFGTGSVNIIYE